MKYFCLVKDFEFKSFFLNSHAHISQRIPNRNRNGLLIRGNNRINIVMLIFYLMPPGKMKIYNMTHLHYDQKIKPSENSMFKCSLIPIFKNQSLFQKLIKIHCVLYDFIKYFLISIHDKHTDFILNDNISQCLCAHCVMVLCAKYFLLSL